MPNQKPGMLLLLSLWLLTIGVLFGHYYRPDPPHHTCPSFPTTPSNEPIDVEWTHDDGAVRIHLGSTGYPVVMDPGTGRRWILLPTKLN